METVRELFSGDGERESRRLLIEAMIGVTADKDEANPAELAAIENHVAGHPLFADLGADEIGDLVRLAHQSRSQVPVERRTQVIARGLPGRIRRCVAYGVGAEVAGLDSAAWHADKFLEDLRFALRVSSHEANQLADAAQTHRLVPDLDDRMLRLRGMIPTYARVFALRAQSYSVAADEHRFAVRDMFLAVPDLVRPRDELDVELYRAFRKPRDPSVGIHAELREIGQSLPDPVDRYWMLVYVLAAEAPSRIGGWRLNPFVGMLQTGFHIGDADMDLAVDDALAFPPDFPRPL